MPAMQRIIKSCGQTRTRPTIFLANPRHASEERQLFENPRAFRLRRVRTFSALRSSTQPQRVVSTATRPRIHRRAAILRWHPLPTKKTSARSMTLLPTRTSTTLRLRRMRLMAMRQSCITLPRPSRSQHQSPYLRTCCLQWTRAHCIFSLLATSDARSWNVVLRPISPAPFTSRLPCRHGIIRCPRDLGNANAVGRPDWAHRDVDAVCSRLSCVVLEKCCAGEFHLLKLC